MNVGLCLLLIWFATEAADASGMCGYGPQRSELWAKHVPGASRSAVKSDQCTYRGCFIGCCCDGGDPSPCQEDVFEHLAELSTLSIGYSVVEKNFVSILILKL